MFLLESVYAGQPGCLSMLIHAESGKNVYHPLRLSSIITNSDCGYVSKNLIKPRFHSFD